MMNESPSPVKFLQASSLFGLITLAAGVGLCVPALSSPEMLREVFGKSTYYILWLVFLVWLVQLGIFLRCLNFSWKAFLLETWPVLSVALLMTLITAVAIPPTLRVLSDETNLASVSRSMLYSKTVYNYTIGKYYYGTFSPILGELEKRPMLYPFFAHLVHLMRGYDVRNLFLLNLGALFVFLSGIGITVRRLLHKERVAEPNFVWVTALLLVLSCPIVTLTATSAGFDFFAAVFFAWTFVVLFHFLRRPQAETMAFLWMNLILLSHTRYESFIFFGIIATGLLLFRRMEVSLLVRYSHVYLLTPLAMLPLVLQRVITHGKYENPQGVAVFAAEHFSRNVGHLVQGVTDFSFFYPYPNLLLWLAVALVPLLGLSWWRERKSVPDEVRQLVILFLCSLAAYLTIVLSYYLGDPLHPTAARFFALPVATLALVPIAAHRVWPRMSNQRLLLAGAAGMIMLYLPVAGQNRFGKTLELVRETEHALTYVQGLRKRNILVVSDRPGIFTAFEFGAVDFDYANKHRQELLADLHNRLYSEIIVLQEISYAGMKPIARYTLHPDFPLTPARAEYQITGQYFLRISHVATPPLDSPDGAQSGPPPQLQRQVLRSLRTITTGPPGPQIYK